MRKVALIDRDGTLINEPKDFQIDSVEKFELLPKTISSLKVLKNLGYQLIMVTNQDGLGTTQYPREIYNQLQNLLLGILRSEGIIFDAIYLCPHLPKENCECRKPLLGMLPFDLIKEIDRETSIVIGDRESDMAFARNLGVRGLQIEEGWDQVISDLLNADIKVKRKTKETDIELVFSEYRKDVCIETPNGFFSHMLETFAKYSGLGVCLKAQGDVHVDEHHLVEDVAIVIGNALEKLRQKNPNRTRFANVMVMDEAKVEMAIDFGGRSYLVKNLLFSSPLIGKFPSEMISHFFKSLCDNAKISLNINLTGENNHHKAEVLFKSLGMILNEALKARDLENEQILSTKGSL